MYDVYTMTMTHTMTPLRSLPFPVPTQAGAGGTAAEIEALAGATAKPAIFRPVEMTLVPDSVSTIQDVSVALRHCVDLCTSC